MRSAKWQEGRLSRCPVDNDILAFCRRGRGNMINTCAVTAAWMKLVPIPRKRRVRNHLLEEAAEEASRTIGQGGKEPILAPWHGVRRPYRTADSEAPGLHTRVPQ